MQTHDLLTIAIFVGVSAGIIWLGLRILKLARTGQLAIANAKKAQHGSIRGHIAERAARRELESLGFQIIKHQVETEIGWWIDDQWFETRITADYLVRRNGKNGIVEVKTGNESKATHRHTRRQLLEYQVAFSIDEIYLYNADQNKLQRIDFGPLLGERNPFPSLVFWLICASFAGFFIGYFLSH